MAAVNAARQWMQQNLPLPDPLRPQAPAIDDSVRHEVESALHHGNALDLSVRTLDGQVRYTGLQALRLLLQDEILHLLAAEPQTCTQAASARFT
jgi:hypothetical protein